MLLGRERECAFIEATLASVRAGAGTGVLVLGEAGIGKSALLAHAAERAEEMLVLRAGGVASEMHLSWAGLHSLLWPHADLIGRLPPPQQAALRSALGLAEPARHGPFLVSAAVVSLVGVLAEERPVLVLVDDLQWVDHESIHALTFALRRMEADRIGMVFACRDTEPGAPDLHTVGERFVELVVGPLDDVAVERFLETRVPLSLDHRIRRRIADAARGNPLALTELSAENAITDAESGSVPLARRLEQGFLRRAHALPEKAQQLLLLAAADESADVADLVTAGARGGLDGQDLLAAERSRLLVITGSAVAFSHPLVRSAVYREASDHQRREAHLALARATADRDTARSTWHRAAAATGPDEEVSRALEQVGAEAQRRAAMTTSARAYRRAAELTEDADRRVDCLTRAAEAAWESGDSVLAQQLVESARRRARKPQQVARAEHLRGWLQVNTGVVLEGFEILHAAAAGAARGHLPQTAATILADAYRAASYEGIDDLVRDAGSLARRLVDTDTPTPQAAYVAGVAALWGDDPQEASPLLQQVVEDGRTTQDPARLVLTAKAALYAGDTLGGLTYGTRAAVLAREHGALATLATALEMVSFADLHTSLDRAESSALEGLQAARETHQTPSAALQLSTLATVAAYRGDEKGCLAATAEVFGLARRHGLALPEGMAVGALGLLDLALGRPEVAADRLERLLETTAHPMIRLSVAADFVEAAARAEAPDRAGDVVALMARWADSNGSAAARAVAARCRAVVCRSDEAVALFEQCLRLVEGHGSSLDRARTHLLLGEHLRRARQRAQARPHLRAAWDLFDRLGAVPWAERARTELRATGESARSRRSSGTEQLTPQERHIAALVAEGASSKQVAAQLFLSPRTVDYHLRKVFTKTGISSRTQLRTLDLER